LQPTLFIAVSCSVLFIKEYVELLEYIISELGLQIIVLEIQIYQ